MTIIVIVIAGPAAHLCRCSLDEGYDGVIGDTAAFYAVIVNDIT